MLPLVLAAACGLALATTPAVDCTSAPQSGFPFCNTALPVDARVSDLISRLTIEEKINQTCVPPPRAVAPLSRALHACMLN